MFEAPSEVHETNFSPKSPELIAIRIRVLQDLYENGSLSQLLNRNYEQKLTVFLRCTEISQARGGGIFFQNLSSFFKLIAGKMPQTSFLLLLESSSQNAFASCPWSENKDKVTFIEKSLASTTTVISSYLYNKMAKSL